MANQTNLCQPRVSTRDKSAFTIVELLVVVAIISVLMGLLLPALSGVQKRSRKTTELNSIKQVYTAWTLYGQNNNDAALPGFLTREVQDPPVANVSRGWGVSYEYPNHNKIPVDANNYAGPWTWRLLSYLDYNHDMIHAHLGESEPDEITMIAEAQSIAYEPAFAYNGFYLGGYWEMNGAAPSYPVYRYNSECNANSERMVIPTTIGQIKRSSEVVAFCAATKLDSSFGGAFFSSTKLSASAAGTYLVTPPTLGNVPQWRPYDSDPIGAVEKLVSGDAFVPLGRHTGSVALVWADGHTDNQGYNALFDQTRWIDSATTRTYTHVPCP